MLHLNARETSEKVIMLYQLYLTGLFHHCNRELYLATAHGNSIQSSGTSGIIDIVRLCSVNTL